jgi:tight adherence protein C
MDNPLFLIALLTFLGVALFIVGGFSYAGQRKERKELIQRVREFEQNNVEAEKPYLFRIVKRNIFKTLMGLGRLAKFDPGGGDPSFLRKMFLKAGYRGDKGPLIFSGVKFFLAVLLSFLFLLIKLFFIPTMVSLHFMVLGILAALLGFYIPNLWLRIIIDRRKAKITEGIPDALDLMVVCAEAGIGLDAAINRVGEEIKLSNKPLSEEFKLMSLELRAGKPRREALKDLAMRTDLEDVNSLASLLIQTEKFGTNIAQALRVHSDSMRVKRFQRAEEVAAKLPVKLLFPLIFFIFPSLFVAILGPAAIRIFRTLLPTLGGH